MVPSRDRALRLRTLWQCWFLALLFHTDLGLMPLFHGLTVEIESQVARQAVAMIFWAMLAYGLVPLGALLLITYAETAAPDLPCRRRSRWRWQWQWQWQWWRRCHLGLSLFYTLTNGAHLVVDLVIPDSRGDQVALMAVMLVIGLMINREALLWCRDRPDQGSDGLPIGEPGLGA